MIQALDSDRDPRRPLVALRTLDGTLGLFKAWHVIASGRSVPMPTYEEAQEWAYRLASQTAFAGRVTRQANLRQGRYRRG